VSVR